MARKVSGRDSNLNFFLKSFNTSPILLIVGIDKECRIFIFPTRGDDLG